MHANPEKCVILVPALGGVEQRCEESLRTLEQRGYPVRRVGGYAAIDQGRSQMATDALNDGFEELMWIDSDIAFDPNAVQQLREYHLPFTCGIYPMKGQRQIAASTLPATKQLMFGKGGGLFEIRYVGFGFVLTRREVYTIIREQLRLPICNQMFPRTLVPYFLPLLLDTPSGPWYLGEDYAFCERARRCGFHVQADTSIRLWHIGSYGYGWEDAGRDVDRYATYSYHMNDGTS